jgi:hypothetical protein
VIAAVVATRRDRCATQTQFARLQLGVDASDYAPTFGANPAHIFCAVKMTVSGKHSACIHFVDQIVAKLDCLLD